MYTPNRMSSYVTRPPCCCSAFSNTKTITPFCQCCTFPILHLFYWKIESILILELSPIRYNHLICHTMLTFMNFYFWRSRSPFIEYVHVTTSMGSRYEMLIFCIEIHLLFKTICSFCWFLSFKRGKKQRIITTTIRFDTCQRFSFLWRFFAYSFSSSVYWLSRFAYTAT